MRDSTNLQFILQEGEGQLIEFKEKISDLDREIVAMANSTGGSIFLGITDGGILKGIEVTNKLKSQIVDIARNCDPSIHIDFNRYDSENVLEIIVAEGTDKPYRCKDGFFLRIGPSSQKLRRDEIINLINSSGKIQFDRLINPKFKYPSDFDSESLHYFMTLCGIVTHLSLRDILINLGVAKEEKKEIYFTNAGILFFAKDPQKFFPESYITAVVYSSPNRFSIIDKQDIKGNLIQQIEQSMNFILRNIRLQADTRFQAIHSITRRKDIYDYPIAALREAVINAVVHRDYYYDGSHIYIHIYPDHIDIENPGGLYNGLTLENLGKRSIRRNILIADLLHHGKYIERVGSGFDRIKTTLIENNNPPMEITATNFFDIRFYKRIPDFSIAQLTPRQATIVTLFQDSNQLTKKEISLALNISEDTTLRELKHLINSKIITKLGTGKAIRYVINR